MVTEIYSSTTTSISELKKNPIKASEYDVVCVLNRCSPAFYTVSPSKMEEINENEKLMLEVKESVSLCIKSLNSALKNTNEPHIYHGIIDAIESISFILENEDGEY